MVDTKPTVAGRPQSESGTPPSMTPPGGLTEIEAAERRSRGLTNAVKERSSRTVAEILRANVLTRFNFILGSLLVVILVVGQPQDALFGVVLLSNALIGIAQELRAKRTLDRLALLSAPQARIVRNGETGAFGIDEIVLDDLVETERGDQVAADGVVRMSSDLEVDESLLTGESRPVAKQVGDLLLSGSFVVAGSGRYQATAVGSAAYARRLAAEARRFSIVRSELVEGINRFLRYVTWAIVPVAVLTIVSQLHANDSASQALTGTVAALVGMVPQGLVLLTSIAFGVAAVSLARRRVVVQQLPAVEGLARVDVVCFDKTGTLTDGTLAFHHLVPLDAHAPVEEALGALADDEHANETLAAVGRRFAPPTGWVRRRAVPFSSARKWSSVEFSGRGTWVLGAPEIVLRDDSLRAGAADEAGRGNRVVAVARSQRECSDEALPSELDPVALVVLTERLRPEAAETVAYFNEQGVALKVLSGDSALTVGSVARQAGIPGADRPVDARELPDDPTVLGEMVEDGSVFGRVSPAQKQAMVSALQARGHTVAMTGDGVNDVLAMKLADIGIAMGTGASATRAVAELVLLDDRFAMVPTVVGEGRRVAANIERVANVFLTKTVWATLLAVATGAMLLPYPFLPRQLTIVDTLTIGVPCFFLALAPNRRRFVPGFVRRVLGFALPAGMILGVTTFAAFWVAHDRALPVDQQRTEATIVILALGLYVLTLVALPLTWRRAVLVAAVAAGFVALFPIEAVRRFYALDLPHGMLGISLWCIGAGMVALSVQWALLRPPSSAPRTRAKPSRPSDPSLA